MMATAAPAVGRDSARSGFGWTGVLVLSVAAVLVVWLIIAASSSGYDTAAFKVWSLWLAARGISQAYQLTIDYPPGTLYLMAAAGQAYRLLVDPSLEPLRAMASPTFTWLVKLPPILFHLATGVVVFLLVRRQDARFAWLAATVLLFDPAAIFAVAHWGAYDPVHSLFSLLAVAAVAANRPTWAGAASAGAALAKPQSWILVPLVGALAWRSGGWRAVGHCAAGGAGALLIGLAPFILDGRLDELARLPSYMDRLGLDNQVISANAHNLWWLPTLAKGRWIQDTELLRGLISYRAIALALVGLVLLGCLGQLRRVPPPDSYLLAAALATGWFFVTPRAHENHAFFVLPFLAVAWPSRPRLVTLYALASLGLLSNMALQDPTLMVVSDGPRLAPMPGWVVGLTVLNVALFAALLAGLGGALGMGIRLPGRRLRGVDARSSADREEQSDGSQTRGS